MSFIRILLHLCIKHTERVKQSRLFPPLPPRQRYFNTARKLCWFPSTQSPISTAPRRGEREREGNVMACVISIRPHFQQNTAIFTVSAPTDPLRWPLDGRKTDELRYLASGGCFSSAPRQTRFLPSSLFHVSCSPALSTWKQQIQWLENKARLSLRCLFNFYDARVAWEVVTWTDTTVMLVRWLNKASTT